MKKVLLTLLYVLGLSAFLPVLAFNHRSDAAWPLFLAPLVSAVIADSLARRLRFTQEVTENRVIWLIASFILMAQFGRFALGLDAPTGFTEYLALNALYQIVIVLVAAASDRRGAKPDPVSPSHVV